MSIRKSIYFSYLSLRGSNLPRYYEELLKEDRYGLPADITNRLLAKMLTHCRSSVPYYADIINKTEGSFISSPTNYLSLLPFLTKDIIRKEFEKLKSNDLDKRRWYFNTSGGSTGEPVKFIQDQDFGDRSLAIALLFSKWAGGELGNPEIRLWGSEQEVFHGTLGLKARFFNFLLNTTYLNAFLMTPEKMREYIRVINNRKPSLIIAYTQAIYELACFAEQEQIPVIPQEAVITSAGTLYPFMREKIENVFGCQVFNRYGSRDIGAIACQCSAGGGMHVDPWGNFVEIVDEEGNCVPTGVEGEIVITSLTNYSMPLIRYKIGDRGILAEEGSCPCGRRGQILKKVSGRVTDSFKTSTGRIVPAEYFIHLIGVVLNTGLIKKFQVIQKSYDVIVLKIVAYNYLDTAEIVRKIKLVMGEQCTVKVEMVNEILPSSSGKYRYTISEVNT